MSDNAKLEKSTFPFDLGLIGEPIRYKGACHCRKFQFEFDHSEIKSVTECNCSMCTQRGALYVYASGDRFHITAGSLEAMTVYQFNKRIVKQYFCPSCGCAPIGTASDGKVVGINVRSLDDFDLKKIIVELFDGASM